MRTGYNFNLEQIQVQKLVMTPELRQAIAVLQMSSLELGIYISKQLEENPLLELVEEEDPVDISGEETNPEEIYDFSWEDYFNDARDTQYFTWERGSHTALSYENVIAQIPTLQEHLLFQLYLSKCDSEEKKICEYLIGNLDEHGYLQISAEVAAEDLKIKPQKVERMLKIIQTFDPPGVGARTLEECLLIQVEQAGIRECLLTAVIRDHLRDLADGGLNKLARRLGVGVKEVQRVVDIIKTMDPKPGRNFARPYESRLIIPDVVVEKIAGDYTVLVNDVAPRLNISGSYKAILSGEGYEDAVAKEFIEKKLNSARWLIRSIEQRKNTLYRVAETLVELQRDFLERGVKYLRPLNLREVAEILGLHESTVSRATSGKYIQTPRGVFEMKYFFSSGLGSAGGGKASSVGVKKLLKEIVSLEDPGSPFSDQELAGKLRRQGIIISRRTVAKYREGLGIPAKKKRRRY